ncbi:MAG: S8 family serine peptidase [Chitinophagaceae bacterium]
MKRICSFLLLFIMYTASAQTTEKIAYYYQGKKIFFPVNYERVVIRLTAGEATDPRRRQIATVFNIPDTAVKAMADSRLLSAKLPAGRAAGNIKTMIASLGKQAFVDFIHPCFKSPYGKDMGYGDELVVKLKSTTAITVFDKLLQQLQCSIFKKYPFADHIYVVSAGKANGFDALAVANRFFETGLFEYATPDCTLFDGLFADPNDPLYSYQWAHKNTGSGLQYNGLPAADMSVQQAWGISTGAGIKIAVLDEGVDTGHADLKANLLQGFDCLSGTANPGDGRPLNGARAHGTNCTGIIAAVANNNIGVAGVAPDSKIIPINLAAANGPFTSDINIASGFDYAWQHAADVISNSWGGGAPSDVLDDAINRAITLGRGGKGSVVLFASGNNNAGLSYPAALSNVIAVGGINMCEQRKSPTSCDGETWWGASYGTGLDVVAPCVKIASTDISGTSGYNTNLSTGDYYLTFNGTSSATPNAAAVVALILAVNNNLTVTQVRTILEGSCDKLPAYNYNMVADQPNGSWNSETGHGRVNAFHAVQAAASGIFCNVQVKANGATRFCPGGSVSLAVISPVAGTSYQWRKDGLNISTGVSINASVSGSYDVVATTAGGCVASSAALTVTQLINTPVLTAAAGPDVFICAGSSTRLGGNPVAANGAPVLKDKRVYGMDWFSNSFVRFSLDNPLQYDTIAKNVVSFSDDNNGYFFTGGDFTPYGYYAIARVTNRLFKVDTANGTQQLIGISAPPAGFQWTGLAWDPAGKNLYGIAANASSGILCIIHPFTAAVTQVAPVAINGLLWVAVRNNGDMYAMSTNDFVYKIDKITGARAILPNSIGANTSDQQDADFDPVSDSLYIASYALSPGDVSDFRRVNTQSGISTVIGSLGGLSRIDAMAIAGPAYQYNWSPATGLNSTTVSVPVASPSATTTYTLNVTDMCGNTASSQVTVTVNPQPSVAVTAPADSICVGETVRLSATKNNVYTYQWYRNSTLIAGATDSFYVAAVGGAYTVKAVQGSCEILSLPYPVKSCELRLNSNTPVAACATYLYDSGGPDGNYANNETYTRTITASTPGDLLKFTLNSFISEPGNDVLTIYDGTSTSAPVLASISGSPVLPLTFKSGTGALTFRFTSNSANNNAGWGGALNCLHPGVYRSRVAGFANESSSWEVKAGNGFVNAADIPVLGDDSIIVQTGHAITLNSAAEWDQVWVQPGGSLRVLAPLVLKDGPGNDLQVDGTLTVDAGFSNTGVITGNGVLTITGGLSNYNSATSNILVRTEITGNTPQSFNTSGSFGTLYIKNPSVTLNTETSFSVDSLIIDNGTGTTTINAYHPLTLVTVKNRLALRSGRLILPQNTILDLAQGYIIEGGNAASFVEGEMQCNSNVIAPLLFFPVGKDVYRPVNLNVQLFSPGKSLFQVRVLNTPVTGRTLPATINKISNTRYYRIVNAFANGPALVSAAVTLTYGADDGVTDPASLRIAHENGAGNWVDIGGTGTGSGSGTITSTVNFSNFYPDFVIANAQGGNNALPVKWLQVSARQVNKQVQVNWKVTEEINVKGYTLERSDDGIAFSNVVLVNASAVIAAEKQYEAIDAVPLKGNNYYRIRQTDKDGKYSYSKTVIVNVSSTGNFLLWPNPATETVTIQNRQPIVRLQCFNSTGQLLFEVKPATNQYTIPVRQWANGIYYVQVTSGGQVTQARFVKE